MAKAIEKWLYPLKASKTQPPGYKVEAQINDQWGDRRKVKGRFRATDDSPEALEQALSEAREFRDEIEANRNDVGWLRKQFPSPKEKQKYSGFDALVTHHARFREPDRSQQTLEDFVELGLKLDEEGRPSVDPMSDERGFLRRIIEDTGGRNISQKQAIWSVIKNEWGGIHRKRLGDISGADVDDFVRWMEKQTKTDSNDKVKPRWAKASIKKYRLVLRSMIKHFAAYQEKVNPLELKPSTKKPARVKGREKQRKVPTPEELAALEEGFRRRNKIPTENPSRKQFLPRRLLTWHIHRVLRRTGLRPSEAFHLETRHVDTLNKRLLIEGGAVDQEAGPTKTGKLKGDRDAGTRLLPVEAEVIRTIEEWLEIRTQYRYPDPLDCPIIFCDSSGNYLTADSLCNHYRHASKLGGLSQPITPYQMRHWRNDTLRQRGCPIEVRRELLGHIEDETNLNYTNAQAEEARAWFDDDENDDAAE